MRAYSVEAMVTFFCSFRIIHEQKVLRKKLRKGDISIALTYSEDRELYVQLFEDMWNKMHAEVAAQVERLMQ